MSNAAAKAYIEQMSPVSSQPNPEALVIEDGRCFVFYAFDLGISINLALCDKIVDEPRELTKFRHNQRAPRYFDYNPLPIRLVQSGEEFSFTELNFKAEKNVDVTIFDFGAISVTYEIDIRGPLSALINLSAELYENELLREDATRRANQIYREIFKTITKPELSELCEDYLVFNIRKLNQQIEPRALIREHAQTVGQILRCENERVSDSQLEEALSTTVSYSPQDIVVIDWNTSLIYGGEPLDVLAVMEFANVELLEMRYQDGELDEALESAYQAMNSGKRFGADLKRVAQLQVDSAMMYEGVNNALKLLGDQFLARVYSLISKRFHLSDWDSSILRKLDTLNSIYMKISDQASQRRTEMMELIIIGLIAFEVVLSVLNR